MPRRSLLCEQRLKDQGVLGSFIHREQYSLDLIPFDGDLLSMESESAFKVSADFFLQEKIICTFVLHLSSKDLKALFRQVSHRASKEVTEQMWSDFSRTVDWESEPLGSI